MITRISSALSRWMKLFTSVLRARLLYPIISGYKKDKQPPSRRRVWFDVTVAISQLLLIALAVAWLLHMLTIAIRGSIYFVERKPLIFWVELTFTILIVILAIVVLVIQIKRLGDMRRDDDHDPDNK
jgi:hypothetical protein